MVLGWDLSTIRSKVRATTGRPDASMMSNSTIDTYINNYYQLVLTKELKIFWGYTYYQFFTQQGVDQYVAPSGFQTVNPQAWADGFQLDWYLSPDLFYQDYPQQENKLTVATGDGITNSFGFSVSAYPVIGQSVYVTDGVQVVNDVGTGSYLVNGSFANALSPFGAVGGSIAYQTGNVTGLAFPVAPAANTNIIATSMTYFAARPQGIMFYKSKPLTDSTATIPAPTGTINVNNVNMFILRPVPDQVYLVKMEGIQMPPTLINDDDVPFRPDLGPLIAYGASLEIFADFNQMDQYQETMTQFMRYKDVSMQDTYEELLYQRSVPRF